LRGENQRNIVLGDLLCFGAAVHEIGKQADIVRAVVFL